MKTNSSFLIMLFLLIIAPITAPYTELEDDDPYNINPHDYEYYKKNAPADVRDNCKFEVMNAYSLFGDAKSLSQKHEYCSNLKRNCCGALDQERIPKLWKYDEKRIRSHTVAYLKMMRYMLGFGKQYYKIAKELIKAYEANQYGAGGANNQSTINLNDNEPLTINHTEKCYRRAKDLLKINYDATPKAEALYHMLNVRAEYMMNVRKNFYCMLCSPEYQQSMYTTNFMFRKVFSKRIYYSDKFCENMVRFTFPTAYQLYDSYNRYLRKLMKMSKCIDIPNNRYDKDNSAFKKVMDDPLNIESIAQQSKHEICNWNTGQAFTFSWCEWYCQSFNVAMPSRSFDGDLKRTFVVYDFLTQLQPMLEYPNANEFNDDLVLLKRDIDDNLKQQDNFFFKSVNKLIDFTTYKSDFTSFTESDPMIVGDFNGLGFLYKNTMILQVSLALALSFVFSLL